MSMKPPTPKDAHLHLLLGPVGAGKSTYAIELAQKNKAIRLTLDEWMTTLFQPDRPEDAPIKTRLEWYQARVHRCMEQIWRLATESLTRGHDVILEVGLVRAADRAAFYQRADSAHIPMQIYLLDAPRNVRRARVEQRNVQRGDTFSMEVPVEFFELASDLWEPPNEDEKTVRRMIEVSQSRSPISGDPPTSMSD